MATLQFILSLVVVLCLYFLKLSAHVLRTNTDTVHRCTDVQGRCTNSGKCKHSADRTVCSASKHCTLQSAMCTPGQGSNWPRVSKRYDHATVRSRKIFQRLRNIWVFELKNAQIYHYFTFLGHFSKMCVAFWPFLFAQNF